MTINAHFKITTPDIWQFPELLADTTGMSNPGARNCRNVVWIIFAFVIALTLLFETYEAAMQHTL